MVPRPLAPAQAMRSRTCAHVFQPCLSGASSGEHRGQTSEHAQCTRTRSPAAKISRAKI